MSHDKPEDNGTKANWVRRGTVQPGFRNASLLQKGTSKPSIFEFAVQTGPHRRLHVVYFRCAESIPANCSWERRLLCHKDIRSQLKSVLSQPGCSLFMRQAILPKSVSILGRRCTGPRDITSLLKGRYDYAWRVSKGRTSKARHVVKNGSTISESL